MAAKESALKGERFTEKERRNLAILDIIRRGREVSRAEISRITHLNIVTISNYIDDYISKGLVIEKGLDVSTGGRRPELLDINPRYGYAVGIDLGAPHITEDVYIVGVIIDSAGKIISKARVKKEEEPAEKFMEKVVTLVQELLSKSKLPNEKVKGIGIGIWGVLDRYRGIVRYAVEKGGILSYATLQSLIERRFNIPTFVEHDATAGVLGEKWMGFGFEAEAENILYMCSDSSCGLFLNGELYYGASKSAGELNINPPMPGVTAEDPCWARYDYGCGFRSRGIDLGITSRARAYIEQKHDATSKVSILAGGDPSKITFGIVIEAAKAGDKIARDLVTEAGDYLGAKLAFLINFLNPEVVVIGRGVEKAGEILLDAIMASVKKWAYEESLKVARVVTTSLGEDSIACGAAALIMQQIFARI
ncbi:MAG: ROK family protein [Candidatus Omnitrophica bacterium]|nr:ROK family protein [Candidatus Omnitrophota bacterium]